MTHTILQQRLMRFLWVYEFLVIASCMAGGAFIAASQGGSLIMAAPLLLVGAAEMLRIPLAALTTRLGVAGHILAGLALLAISIVSFEGLSMVFESFLDNRTGAVLAARRVVDHAEAQLSKKNATATEAKASLSIAREKVARLDADITNKEQHPPVQPGFSGKTCTGRNGQAVTCFADRQARSDFAQAQQAHITTLADLRTKRAMAQKELDGVSATVSTVTRLEAEQQAVNDARGVLSDTMNLSPMHRLAASLLGVRTADLTEGQFEGVKRWGVLGLAGAFATLSGVLSIVAHLPERNERRSKLSMALRRYLARRRKQLVRVNEVKVPSGTRVIYRYVPANFEAPKSTGPMGKFEFRSELVRAYKELGHAD